MLPVELLSYHYYRRFLDTTQVACVAGGFFFCDILLWFAKKEMQPCE